MRTFEQSAANGGSEPIVTNAAGCIDDRKLRKADIAFGKVGPSRSLTLGLYINAQLHQTGRSRPQFLVTRESFYSNRLLVPPPGKLRTVSQSNVNKDTCDMCAHAKVNDCAAFERVAISHIGLTDNSGAFVLLPHPRAERRIALFGEISSSFL